MQMHIYLRFKEQLARLSHKDTAEPNNWFYQDFSEWELNIFQATVNAICYDIIKDG